MGSKRAMDSNVHFSGHRSVPAATPRSREVLLQTFLSFRDLLCHKNEFYGNQKYTSLEEKGVRETFYE
jgi:hypothetical protein